ncbi:MAG: hypothetical protein WCS37_08695 [Chloroflexota bacterium]|nr:hypothetical protein [Chloroflexota bacterium]
MFNVPPGDESRPLTEALSETGEANNSPLSRLKKYTGGLVVTALLSSTLLLSACTDSSSDCVQTTPPTPVPGSFGFTAAQQPTPGTGSYCRSRSTGGYYYIGTGYGSSRSSGSSGGSSSSGSS